MLRVIILLHLGFWKVSGLTSELGIKLRSTLQWIVRTGEALNQEPPLPSMSLVLTFTDYLYVHSMRSSTTTIPMYRFYENKIY